ncbi:pyocin knob domain-containing protein [Xenorhabdus sp. Sc-CR9]|uniref:pyocin knob domain-containing protein n=1 Tax=Xenorhabdus sp. Sc-CR9 TaxID=2584468 RepID=UPI001F347BAF|nr:pyocin knob domain-containing protein [Xenorhabdus sp. Sc-CR9]
MYSQGAISTVSGSAIVRGTGTRFKSNINGVAPAQFILIQAGNGNLLHMIQAVNSDTELVLVDKARETLRNVTYQIQTTAPDSIGDAVRHLVAINSYIVNFLQNMDKWMSLNGTVNVALPNGQTVPLQSIRALQAAVTGKLDKSQNGADIPNKAVFVKNLALGDVLKIGDYGIGSVNGATISNGDYNNAILSGVYAGPGVSSKNGIQSTVYGPCLVLSRHKDHVYQQAHWQKQFYYRYREVGKWSQWWGVWTEGNTTVVDGFLKKASPIIKIWNDGKFETNDESEGATVERLSEGVYLIKNVLGFNADAAWGGVDGGVEIPMCKNKLPLIWVDYKVLPDGSIKLMTYHREHPNAPEFARNVRQGYSDGDLIDIPAGRSISVRVQMPEDSVWNVRGREG